MLSGTSFGLNELSPKPQQSRSALDLSAVAGYLSASQLGKLWPTACSGAFRA
jgi:hypothetical protein